MSAIYRLTRRHGHVFPLLTVAFSLVLEFGGAGIIGAFLAICILTSRMGSISDSIRQFDRAYRTSDSGRTYTLMVSYAAICCFLTFYHNDVLGTLETAIKQLLIAYAIFFHLEKYDIGTLLVAAAVGAIFAGSTAIYDHFFLGLVRAAGVTNPIRFGSIAIILAALSLVGCLFLRRNRAFAILMSVGAFAGLVAAFLSGSMGAAIAIPPMLVMILLRLWNTSRARAAQVTTVLLAALVLLLMIDVGSMRGRILLALDSISEWSKGEVTFDDASVSLRIKMLEITGQLIREHPILGTGSRGWNEAVASSAQAESFATSHLERLNQAHNQFADDLAKGGLVRGLAGLALWFLPLFFFLRSRPFSNAPETVPAMAGLVSCTGFAAVSLTESLMILSLPASIYAVLTCFLMASKQAAGIRGGAYTSELRDGVRGGWAWPVAVAAAVLVFGMGGYQYYNFSIVRDLDFDRGELAYTANLNTLSPIEGSSGVTASNGVLSLAGQHDIYSISTFTVDPTKQYNLSARVRATRNDPASGGTAISIGLVTYSKSGRILDRYVALASRNLNVNDQWTQLTGKSPGVASNNLSQLGPNVAYVRLAVVANYHCPGATTEIDYFRFERVKPNRAKPNME